MKFEEWWNENYAGDVNGWEADSIRTGWNAALKYGSEKPSPKKCPCCGEEMEYVCNNWKCDMSPEVGPK